MAELGVIGRVDDMAAILDAETDATLSYLDALTRHSGGRRGRAALPTPTDGLVYVRTRHATSRAGDPSPHDHVLVANVVRMADDRGGFKAPNTALWRDHLHAATMVGRMASAAKAVELGYAIAPDPGPSGRLGHWRIVGIPDVVREVHSKRAAEITAEMERRGFDSPRASEVAGRATRSPKARTPLTDLMGRWHAELADVGYPVAALSQLVDEASRGFRLEPVGVKRMRELIAEALGPQGNLGRRKVFSRADVIVAVAPSLYGQPSHLLDAAVGRLIADPEVIPLVGVAGTRERAYTTASTLAVEAAIADAVAEAMDRADGPTVPVPALAAAVSEVERGLEHPLTPGQRSLALAATGSGRGAELGIGVAGSGKTTALRVVRAAFEASGYTVIGAATSGQAARTLGVETGIDLSRTLASISWRIDHGQLQLTNRHVVILDEVGATDDPALLRLVCATGAAGAKLVMTGDWRQLGPVGPGGAFEALLRRHKEAVVVLADNVRQLDPSERQALLALRSGSVAEAVEWYGGAGRLRPAGTRALAIEAAVQAWSADIAGGKDALLLAWRRANVAELNRGARVWMEGSGRLSGPELVAPGGRGYRAGDRVVTLAPTAGGELVTSERAVVAGVDVEGRSLALRTEDGRVMSLAGADLGADRLDYGYATTVHRSQGATSTTAHLLADGGGRELAYVAMSRARGASYAYVVADDADQAKEDLAAEWSRQRRPRWAIDTGIPAQRDEGPVPDGPAANNLALRRARLAWEIERLAAAMPTDVSAELDANRKTLAGMERSRDDLATGVGRWAGTEVGQAHEELSRAGAVRRQIEDTLASGPGIFERRRLRAELGPARAAEEVAQRHYDALAHPHRVRLEDEMATLAPSLRALEATRWQSRLWVQAHPEAGPRLAHLRRELTDIERWIDNRRRMLEGREPQLSATERILAAPAPLRTSSQPPVPTPRRGVGRHR